MLRLNGALTACALVIGALGARAGFAETESVSPYIDSLKEEMKSQESDESYTERARKKLKAKSDNGSEDDSGSYTERLKQELSERDSKGRKEPAGDGAEGYLERERNRLGGENKERKSAIAAVKDGTSTLEMKRGGPIRHAMGFKMGAAASRSINVASGGGDRSFEDMYGNSWVPDISGFYEFQPFRSEIFGNIGFLVGGGISYNAAPGTFEKQNLPKPWSTTGEDFGEESRTRFRFMTVPVYMGASYRFHLLRYLRPYVQVAPAAIGYMETRTDGKKAHRGYSTGMHMAGGINILLDFFSKRETWDLYDSWRIKHYYLTLDYSRLSSFSGSVEFDVASYSAGLTFEF